MDEFLNKISSILGVLGVVIVAVVVGFIIYRLVKARYKAARASEALVVSGGKKGPKILVSGGAWVSPFHKFEFFPLSALVVKSEGQSALTSTMVPVVVEWAATVVANTEDQSALRRAVTGFSGQNSSQIIDSLRPTLDGLVRSVVADMDPTALVIDKAGFTEKVAGQVEEKMGQLGFSVRSMVIGDITDKNGHYNDLAAEDREGKRRAARTLTAVANKEISVAEATNKQISESAQLDSDLLVAEKQREVTIRTASIKAETDQAQTDAEYAGQLRAQEREQELAVQRGKVRVVEVQQEQASAEARRQVELTDAETEKQRQAVEAEARKQQSEIAAAAEARRDEIAADAAANVAKRQATGEAEAAVTKAQGEADAINRTTEARARQVRETGLAEAEVAKAKGEAEAAAILARGKAEAEAQREMAEALAANNGANLQVTLAEIQRDTTVKIYTTVGEAMATLGEKATFIDMGGSGAKDGDLLTGILGRVPELLKQLDVKSEVLNGTTFGGSVGSLISSATNGGVVNDATAAPAIQATTHDEPSASPTEPLEAGEESETLDNEEPAAQL